MLDPELCALSCEVTTKHISKTLEPVWDEEHELPSYERGDILQFTVYDYDRGRFPSVRLGLCVGLPL